MGNRPLRLGLVATAIAAVLIGAIWVYPDDAPLQLTNDGELGLSSLANQMRVRSSPLQRPPDEPESSAWVVLLPRPTDDAELGGLVRYVRAGGTLVLGGATDEANRVAAALGIQGRLSSGTILDPVLNQDNPAFPRVALQRDESVTAVLNRPATVLEAASGAGRAQTSRFSFHDLNGDGVWQEGEPVGSFPVIAQEKSGSGSVVLLGSSTLFINGLWGQNQRMVQEVLAGKSVYLAVDASPLTPLAVAKTMVADARDLVRTPLVFSLLLPVLVALMEPRWGDQGGL